jgi:tetratricopeptide (TPR) repeat protein
VHTPAQLAKITLDKHWSYERPFPPLGFLPFSEGEFGNGDSFGLYWPIGREKEEPLVAETWHDEWRVQPTYSSLHHFLLALERAEDETPAPLELNEDPRSPRQCFFEAQKLTSAGELESAQVLLERSVEFLPEFTDALSALWSLYVRTGRTDLAGDIAIRAVISPPSFGLRAFKPLRWLRSARVPTELRDDPLWKRREAVTLEFGGTKQNENYPLLLEAIEEYLEQQRYERALTLMQTYGEFMSSETTAFQERYGFDRPSFVARQVEVSAKLPGGPRNAF